MENEDARKKVGGDTSDVGNGGDTPAAADDLAATTGADAGVAAGPEPAPVDLDSAGDQEQEQEEAAPDYAIFHKQAALALMSMENARAVDKLEAALVRLVGLPGVTVRDIKGWIRDALEDFFLEEEEESVVIGDIVHYVLDGGRYTGECRAMLVTKVWGDGSPGGDTVQGTVFYDAVNDGMGTVEAKSSVLHNEGEREHRTWHWPH